jgi:AcrR family transcriptional regulator
VKRSQAHARGRYHHGDLRNALLERALALVAERGPEGFSLREAAREVGVSPAAAYRHFADKDALVAAIGADGHGRLAAAMERAASRVPGAPGSRTRAAETLLAIGDAYVEFAVRHPSHFRVMFGPCLESEGFAPGCAPSGRDAFGILVGALDDLVATGAIRPEARAGAEISAWAGVHGLASLLVDGAIVLAPRERGPATQVVTRTILLGLGADPALLPAPAGLDADPRRAVKKAIERAVVTPPRAGGARSA